MNPYVLLLGIRSITPRQIFPVISWTVGGAAIRTESQQNQSGKKKKQLLLIHFFSKSEIFSERDAFKATKKYVVNI